MKKLTPAGLQVERALEQGYDVAAFNIYYSNIREDVPMVEGAWPEWHRMISARIGEGPMVGEEFVNSLSDEEVLDRLGMKANLVGGVPKEEMNDLRLKLLEDLSGHEPSLIEKAVRNERGEVVGTATISNPRLEGSDDG
jgi:hypothetical protein